MVEFSAAQAILRRSGFQPEGLLKRLGIATPPETLPFVYVYERSDFSTKLYGAIIYVEHIRGALEDPACATMVTGRCTLATEYDAAQNEYLRVFVELRDGVQGNESVERVVAETAHRHLLEKNAEYRDQVSHGNPRMAPRVELMPYRSAPYFSGTGKQAWIKK